MKELFCGNSKSLTVFEKKPSYMFKRVLITHSSCTFHGDLLHASYRKLHEDTAAVVHQCS